MNMLNDSNFENGFLFEMMGTLPSASEVFNKLLLSNLRKYFGIRNAFIIAFDNNENFLSLTDSNQLYLGTEHPYSSIASKDFCAKKINQKCRSDHMWYDNLTPYIYRSSDLLSQNDLRTSDYISFLRNIMHSSYMVIMPFDIDGCLHLCISHNSEEGDFTDQDLKRLEDVYRYIARSLSSFKAIEKPKILSDIKDEIICSNENAYLITNLNNKILTANPLALEYLSAMQGRRIRRENLDEIQPLLSFILQKKENINQVRTVHIDSYIFQVHPFPVTYIHGIVEIYHWITIAKKNSNSFAVTDSSPLAPLTKREKEVADLLCQGLTYRAIADQLCISFHTVKNHVQNILSKYAVSNRIELSQIYTEKII